MLYVEDRREIPRPSRIAPRAEAVTLPALTELKLALNSTMLANGVEKAELARRLDCQQTHVNRLLDIRRTSRLDQLEGAFRALGKRLSVHVQDAA